MEKEIDLLLIGGCADGERMTAPKGLDVFDVAPRTTLAADRRSPSMIRESHRNDCYRVEKLHENGKLYHVAICVDHDRPVIETLIDGYKRS